MEWLTNNYVLVIGLIIIAIGAVITAYKFTQKSNEQKVAAIREWLKYAVTVTEKALGEKTGKLKLQMAWSMATAQFPFITKVMTFDQFAEFVDEALKWMNKQLEDNPNIRAIVIGETGKEYES
jgi:hypothetical protein